MSDDYEQTRLVQVTASLPSWVLQEIESMALDANIDRVTTIRILLRRAMQGGPPTDRELIRLATEGRWGWKPSTAG